jgi:hypothetical protein
VSIEIFFLSLIIHAVSGKVTPAADHGTGRCVADAFAEANRGDAKKFEVIAFTCKN